MATYSDEGKGAKDKLGKGQKSKAEAMLARGKYYAAPARQASATTSAITSAHTHSQPPVLPNNLSGLLDRVTQFSDIDTLTPPFPGVHLRT